MRACLEKRSMRINQRRTSVALEPEFWTELEHIARAKGLSLPKLFGLIREESDAPLASRARVYALRFCGAMRRLAPA